MRYVHMVCGVLWEESTVQLGCCQANKRSRGQQRANRRAWPCMCGPCIIGCSAQLRTQHVVHGAHEGQPLLQRARDAAVLQRRPVLRYGSTTGAVQFQQRQQYRMNTEMWLGHAVPCPSHTAGQTCLHAAGGATHPVAVARQLWHLRVQSRGLKRVLGCEAVGAVQGCRRRCCRGTQQVTRVHQQLRPRAWVCAHAAG